MAQITKYLAKQEEKAKTKSTSKAKAGVSQEKSSNSKLEMRKVQALEKIAGSLHEIKEVNKSIFTVLKRVGKSLEVRQDSSNKWILFSRLTIDFRVCRVLHMFLKALEPIQQ